MASDGHNLQQRKAEVERNIKTLVNQDLKEICKTYGYQVSGTKAVLQTRCLEILNNHVREGDQQRFAELQWRVKNHGHEPPRGSLLTSANSYPGAGSYGNYNMPSQRGGTGMRAQMLPPGGKYFKSSPFYEMVETLVPFQDLPEMPQNRHTVKANLTLRPETAQQFRNDNLRILMYCGQSDFMGPHNTIDVAFPNQIEVKVNDVDVKANFKGLKNKPGSTKPADLTSFVRKFGNQPNIINITYALTNKRFTFVVYLVRYITADKLVDRVKRHNIIRKQKVLDAMAKANADPDIAATSIKMSLKDPISTMRITLPVRSSHCTHNQCFDAAMFMQLQEQAPQWSCPICTKVIPFDTLCVDEYFEDILNNTSKATEKVDVEPSGEWSVAKVEEDDSQANGTSSKARASYDDDFDDDLVEVEQPTGKQVNGLKRESQNPSQMLSPATTRGGAWDTPPLSSREPSVAQSASSAQRQNSNKRPQGAVIDLTLSDDEDEPPRPAKRQQTSNRQSSGNNSYNTPTSIPDQRYQPQQHQQHQQSYTYSGSAQRQADAYRPSSSKQQDHHTQAPSFNAYSAQSSLSPQTLNSPTTFGQSGWSARPPPPNQTFGGGGGNYSPFPPSSPFSIRPPSHHDMQQQGQSHPQSPQQQQQGVGLKLPPIAQQPQTSFSPPPPVFPGGWRSDSGEYGGGRHGGYSQSPSG